MIFIPRRNETVVAMSTTGNLSSDITSKNGLTKINSLSKVKPCDFIGFIKLQNQAPLSSKSSLNCFFLFCPLKSACPEFLNNVNCLVYLNTSSTENSYSQKTK